MKGQMDFTSVISCTLIDALASDQGVVDAARISFNREALPEDHKVSEGDAKLIQFLMRNRHGTPFEHNMFKFLVEAPIFVFREHHRHRIGHSYNEMSGRYTQLEPKFYVPERARVQHGKPGAYTYEEVSSDSGMSHQLGATLGHVYREAWQAYTFLLDQGIAKEQARLVLPVGIYSKMYWTCNARSLMHFLGLRMAPTAQAEIRTVAEAAAQALAEVMPVTWAAFGACGRIAP